MAQDPRLLLQKAEKTAQGASGGFSLFGGKTEKYEQAADLYTQAANAFRMQKQNKEAGQAFEKAAGIQSKNLNEPLDMSNSLIEASKVYRKTDPEAATRCLSTAINHYTHSGNFRRAANYEQTLAEIYEVELGDQKRALEAFETAAGWFETDSADALANKLWLRTAELSALENNYLKATELFEKVAKASIDNNLMRWSTKDYFLKSLICFLASGDLIATNRALEQYRSLDGSFTQTREHQLIVDLVGAIEASDQEQFQDKLFQYDQMSKLDKWKTTLLLRVKNSIEDQGEDFS